MTKNITTLQDAASQVIKENERMAAELSMAKDKCEQFEHRLNVLASERDMLLKLNAEMSTTISTVMNMISESMSSAQGILGRCSAHNKARLQPVFGEDDGHPIPEFLRREDKSDDTD